MPKQKDDQSGMRKRTLYLTALTAALLFLQSCASSGKYTVKRGDSLGAIASRYNMSVNDLARMNNINNPNFIHPGQVLRVKGSNVRGPRSSFGSVSQPAPRTANARSSAPNRATASTPNRAIAPAKAPAPPQDRVKTGIKGWARPTPGTIVKSYNPNIPGQKGIHIAGRPNQSIVASHNGEVVFAGRGNTGYGQLIIIKHNGNTYSAYGYLASISVDEGMKVNRGQQIATMGRNTEGKDVLYFEIRTQGQTVNPANYI